MTKTHCIQEPCVISLLHPIHVDWAEPGSSGPCRLAAYAIGAGNVFTAAKDAIRQFRIGEYSSGGNIETRAYSYDGNTGEEDIKQAAGLFIEPFAFYDAAGIAYGSDLDHAMVFVPFTNIAGIQYC